MVLDRKLEVAARDCLCHCGWPRRYVARVEFLLHGDRCSRIYPLCELHGMAFARRWKVGLPA